MKNNKQLPRIITVLGFTDHGPSDGEGSTSCPHCGCSGRYVWSFLCEDGNRYGAMRGCFKLFPKHQFADTVKAIYEKVKEYQKKDWKIASWDENILNACHDLAEKKIDLSTYENIVRSNLSSRDIYLKSKYRR